MAEVWNKGKKCDYLLGNTHRVGKIPWNKRDNPYKECEHCQETFFAVTSKSRFCCRKCGWDYQVGKNHGHKTCNGKDAWNKGIKMPSMSGENHPNYIKDRSMLVKDEKKHLDGRYREWMRGVKNRDGWKCKISNGDCSGRLEAHHILNWVDYPELRYKLNNGITLCQAHHPRGRAKEKRLSPYFQELVSVSSE